MKKYLLTILTLIIGFSTQAQSNYDNTIYLGYSVYESSHYSGGDISAKGFDIGYSRYLKKRLYADISYGLYNFEGRNSIFYLEPEEMDHYNMKVFTLGLGYDIFQSKRFILSGELSYLRQSTHELISQLESGGITIRETGMIVDQTARVQLKARIFITKNLQLIPAAAHGFQLSRYKSNWLRIGLGYSF
ncbi:hypothetical protein KZP23_05650 [Echinicola marina]|uniref:hypothetical protein n=1 Tax=Echinicola marina TaxID=2859768 RepID=UPI001CF6CD13|nr:hypothetical protein [Echinicola marina]UCS94507.1 hypothetical protein KZP23_05650 [Echinicola marina]